jgi:hypothetical protein
VKVAIIGIHTLVDYFVWLKDRQQGSGIHNVDGPLGILVSEFFILAAKALRGTLPQLVWRHVHLLLLPLKLLAALLNLFHRPLDLTAVGDTVLLGLVDGAPLVGATFFLHGLSRPLVVVRRLSTGTDSSGDGRALGLRLAIHLLFLLILPLARVASSRTTLSFRLWPGVPSPPFGSLSTLVGEVE